MIKSSFPLSFLALFLSSLTLTHPIHASECGEPPNEILLDSDLSSFRFTLNIPNSGRFTGSRDLDFGSNIWRNTEPEQYYINDLRYRLNYSLGRQLNMPKSFAVFPNESTEEDVFIELSARQLNKAASQESSSRLVFRLQGVTCDTDDGPAPQPVPERGSLMALLGLGVFALSSFPKILTSKNN